jgi:hypothetical protein
MIKLILLIFLCSGTPQGEQSEPYVRGFFYPEQANMRLVVDEQLGGVDSVVVKGLKQFVATAPKAGPYGEREYLIEGVSKTDDLGCVKIYSLGKIIYCGTALNRENGNSHVKIISYKQKEGN